MPRMGKYTDPDQMTLSDPISISQPCLCNYTLEFTPASLLPSNKENLIKTQSKYRNCAWCPLRFPATLSCRSMMPCHLWETLNTCGAYRTSRSPFNMMSVFRPLTKIFQHTWKKNGKKCLARWICNSYIWGWPVLVLCVCSLHILPIFTCPSLHTLISSHNPKTVRWMGISKLSMMFYSLSECMYPLMGRHPIQYAPLERLQSLCKYILDKQLIGGIGKKYSSEKCAYPIWIHVTLWGFYIPIFYIKPLKFC